jgi:hypothetical protein
MIRSSGFEDKTVISMADIGFDYPEEGVYVSRDYCKKYPDVKENYKEKYLLHYMDHGMREGRRGSLTYDPNYYLFIRPDVAQAWPNDYKMAARHYAGHGVNAQIQAYDHQAPVISNVVISDVSADGYTVSCTATDDWGISKVVFPVWTVLNDQDDLAENFMNTQTGTKNGDTYTFTVKASEHNNEGGYYVTHIYAVDKGGNTVQLALDPVAVMDPKITLKSTASYTKDSNLIKNVKLNTTVQSLLSQFENEVLEVRDRNGNVITGTATVGTGATVNLYNGSALVDSVSVVVLGDVDGNGVVDTTDYLRIKSLYLGDFSMNLVDSAAADIDQNGVVNAVDYQKVKDYFLGNYNLHG